MNGDFLWLTMVNNGMTMQFNPLVNVNITMERFLMGKFTISIVIFHSYVKLPEGNDGIVMGK